MANSEGIGGVHSYLLYGKESTYGTAVTTNLHLGLVTSFKSNINNNLVANRGFVGTTSGGRAVAKFTPGQLDIAGSVDFKVTRWDFLEFVLGTIGGAGPYTYTSAVTLPSITMSHNIDNPGSAATDLEEIFSGVLIEGVTIRTSVGEPVTASVEWKAALAVIDTTLSTPVALPDENVYNFVGGSIELPSGSSLSNIIDSIEVSIKNNLKMMYGVGSRLVQNGLGAELDYSIKVSLKYLDNALVTAALGATTPTATGGPSEYATVVLNFVDGNRSMEMTFTVGDMSDFARSVDLNEPIGEDFTIVCKTLSAVEDRTA